VAMRIHQRGWGGPCIGGGIYDRQGGQGGGWARCLAIVAGACVALPS
jgi:hypothetical protein